MKSRRDFIKTLAAIGALPLIPLVAPEKSEWVLVGENEFAWHYELQGGKHSRWRMWMVKQKPRPPQMLYWTKASMEREGL
jgi:hypothetical protein